MISSNNNSISSTDVHVLEQQNKESSTRQCLGFGVVGIVALIAGGYFGFPVVVGAGTVVCVIAGYHLIQMISASRRINALGSGEGKSVSENYFQFQRLSPNPSCPPYPNSGREQSQEPPPPYDEVAGATEVTGAMKEQKKSIRCKLWSTLKNVPRWIKSFFSVQHGQSLSKKSF